jgi:hypothetical protein
MVMARLEVARAGFIEELKRLKRVVTRKQPGQVVLSYADGYLTLAVGGGEIQLPATGRWPGEARASGAWMSALARVPPVADPVIFQVKGGRLHVATLSMECQWQRKESASLELPLNATWIDTLRLALQNDETTLERSGLAGRVANARQAASACIDNAMKHLAALGVERSELEALVIRAVRGVGP